jgi:eukaryotic-like serine/threonine-protein kinase
VALGQYEAILEGFGEKLDGYPYAARTDTGSIRILRLLSEEAGARIFLAKHAILGSLLEVHQAGPEYKRPQLLRRFVGEAQLLAQLKHPGIQPVLGIAVGPDRAPAILAPHIPGMTLSDYLGQARRVLDEGGEEEHPYCLAERLDIFRKLCAAVSFAHRRGVLHRDLTPAGIWLGRGGEVFIRNWGIAKLLGQSEDPWPTDTGAHQPDNVRPVGVESDASGTSRTRIGTVIGTPAYMAPEQAAGHVDHMGTHSDVFSLGLLLYEMACLRPPYTSEQGDVLGRARAAEVAPIQGYAGEEIVDELVAVIQKATTGSITGRYESAEALGAEVRRVELNDPILAAPDRPFRAIQRWLSKRYRFNFALLWFLSLLVFLALAWGVKFKDVALQWAEQDARIENQAVGDFSMAVAQQGAELELQFSLLSGEVHGWGAGLVQAIENETLGAVGVIDARGATGRGDLGLIVGAERNHVPAYFSNSPRLSADSRRQLFRIGRHWGSWTREIANPVDPASRDLHLAIRWSYVVLTEDGLVTMYPGSTKWDEEGDFREMEEYRRAKNTYSLFWLDPRRDRVDGEPILTVVYPLRSSEENFLGYFGVDIPLNHIREDLLPLPGVWGDTTSFLLDGAGMIMLQSAELLAAPEDDDPLDLSLDYGIFAQDDVVRGVRQRRSGVVRTEDGRLLVWLYLQELGWGYVVEGRTNDLVSASMKGDQP